MENGKLTLTIEEAAKLLGISRRTTYEAARTGKIPAIRIGPRRLVIPRKALMELLGGKGPGEINNSKQSTEYLRVTDENRRLKQALNDIGDILGAQEQTKGGKEGASQYE